MPLRRLNLALLVLFLASLALNLALRLDPTRPNLEFLPEMTRTPRYNAFAPNPNFPDGKTLQAPEPGTIPRGYLSLPYGATAEDSVRAGSELANPFARAPAEASERGAGVYRNFCQPCHGPTGHGDGPVVLRGYPAPPSLVAERAVNMKDGQMFHILTYGQRNMPGYARQLSRDDRWKAVLFVRSLQRPAGAVRMAGGQP
jgi:mono/diheme cytochrome c family protein